MILVNVIAVIILILSLFGGLKEGAVKNFFNLLVHIIAIPIAGYSYRLIAIVISFLPGENWENFVGFFIALALASVVMHFIFFLPRRIIQKLWKKGLLYRLIGGALNIVNAGIGMTVFALALGAYPIFDWLERAVAQSGVLMWLVNSLGFVEAMLPEVFRQVATLMVTGSPV